MEFDHSFEVPLPPAQAWAVLMDIERIAPCMPGAELTEVVDKQTYKGKVSVRLGPVALAFAGIVKFEDIDAANHKARVKAQGTDSKGRGGANAVVDFRIEPSAVGSTVLVHTNLQLSGAVAQYGRGVGVIAATAAQLIGQFANNLKARLTAGGSVLPVGGAPALPASPSQPAKPISGFTLMARVLWDALKRLLTGRA
jgi:carbon monoxide dehydrogenase subunit G